MLLQPLIQLPSFTNRHVDKSRYTNDCAHQTVRTKQEDLPSGSGRNQLISTCISVRLADNLSRLVSFCKCFCLSYCQHFYSQPFSLSRSQTTLASLSIHCPQQTHTTTTTANIAQRHRVTTTHGKEMGGQRGLFYVNRGYSHTVAISV